jgi:hypothetical protein
MLPWLLFFIKATRSRSPRWPPSSAAFVADGIAVLLVEDICGW